MTDGHSAFYIGTTFLCIWAHVHVCAWVHDKSNGHLPIHISDTPHNTHVKWTLEHREATRDSACHARYISSSYGGQLVWDFSSHFDPASLNGQIQISGVLAISKWFICLGFVPLDVRGQNHACMCVMFVPNEHGCILHIEDEQKKWAQVWGRGAELCGFEIYTFVLERTLRKVCACMHVCVACIEIMTC